MTDLPFEEGRELVGRILSKSIIEDDYGLLAEVVESHMSLCTALKEKNATIRKLQHMLFGAPTEKASTIIPELKKMANPIKNEEPTGHGRNGASSYTGARKETLFHPFLKKGDLCPECQKGKVYMLATPSVLVRITGMAPLGANLYERQQLRCNLCGEVFVADAPEGVGHEKYDETAASMVGLLKYGAGMPFNRI